MARVFFFSISGGLGGGFSGAEAVSLAAGRGTDSLETEVVFFESLLVGFRLLSGT